jgi:hypothetical protein
LNTLRPALGAFAATAGFAPEGGSVEALAVDKELNEEVDTDLPTGFPFDVIGINIT